MLSDKQKYIYFLSPLDKIIPTGEYCCKVGEYLGSLKKNKLIDYVKNNYKKGYYVIYMINTYNKKYTDITEYPIDDNLMKIHGKIHMDSIYQREHFII